jgi:hypothetical protein
LEETRKQIDTDIIDFISNNPLCSYYEMVESLLYSPETINKTLTKLKKEKKIGTVDVIERKAKGWKVTK